MSDPSKLEPREWTKWCVRAAGVRIDTLKRGQWFYDCDRNLRRVVRFSHGGNCVTSDGGPGKPLDTDKGEGLYAGCALVEVPDAD